MSLRLHQLVQRFGGRTLPPNATSEELLDLVLDSRTAAPHVLFAALPGTERDGRAFVDQALERGACALLLPDEDHACLERASARAPFWLHGEARRTAGDAAAYVHGDPSRELETYAVTGTNGKSTVLELIAHLLEHTGGRPARIGTLAYRIHGAAPVPAPNTTPDAPSLHRLLAAHLAAGGTSCVLEASSHGLDQDRLAGVAVDVAVFTNLSRDHLDYHGTFEAYACSKQRLFERLEPGGVAVLPDSGEIAHRYAEVARARGARVVTYGVGSRADLSATRLAAAPGGISLFLSGMGISTEPIHLPFPGRHNVGNALAACAAVLSRGANPSALRQGLASSLLPPGRFERATPEGHPFTVRIDYAHTPDALRAALEGVRDEARAQDAGRVVVVFGCGGDRDRGKRPEMGAVAGELADVVVVTSDNPRSEDPDAIVDDVRAGLADAAAEQHVEVDRRRAIELALSLARPGDVVLVAGKGHEGEQILGDRRIPFSDLEVVRGAL